MDDSEFLKRYGKSSVTLLASGPDGQTGRDIITFVADLVCPVDCFQWQASRFANGHIFPWTVLMRSAVAAINDFADRHFVRYVKRTADRPLTSGKLKPSEAIGVAVVLSVLSFFLVSFLNGLTIALSFVALFIAATYPFFKRFFALPQAYLGVAFGFGIPMAFAAVMNRVPPIAWLLLLGNVFWALAYDTEYAMVDRDDDLKIGICTSAITFGRFDVLAVMFCYLMMLSIVLLAGWYEQFGIGFFAGWCGAFCCDLLSLQPDQKQRTSWLFSGV